ncbi:MAG: hypothetical protein ACRD0G_04065, partial [Acidimicrobiales bacterium]
MRTRTWIIAASAAVAALVSSPSVAAPSSSRGCERSFDEAQRTDMESFRDFDAETFRAIHHEDTVTVFPSGRVAYGVDEIMELLAPHFEDRVAVWTWTELHRHVDGCHTAFILYSATYAIPSQGF